MPLPPLTLTSAASHRIRIDLACWGEAEDCLRISVRGDGKSDAQLGFNLEPARPGDEVIVMGTARVAIDPRAATFLRGRTLDLVHDSFQIPNVWSGRRAA
jgi:Fe-S cluster assembly iron-binding protein IscA